MFYAHSAEGKPHAQWQGLSAHLLGVAEQAGRFGAIFGAEKPAQLAGLLHDLGKYSPDFQAYINGAKLKVDHSTAGAATVLQMASGEDRTVAQILAHGGVDRNYVLELRSSGLLRRPPARGVDRNG